MHTHTGTISKGICMGTHRFNIDRQTHAHTGAHIDTKSIDTANCTQMLHYIDRSMFAHTGAIPKEIFIRKCAMENLIKE